MYAENICAALVPPPGAGVVTVTLRLPGVASADAEKVAVSEVELTKVDGTVCPFMATVVPAVKPVPVSVSVVATLIGPELGLIPVSVGTGGLEIVAVSALETEGVAVGVVTVIGSVPVDASRLAGTGMEMAVTRAPW